MLDTTDTDDGKSYTDKLLTELENETVPEESDSKNDKLKQEKAKKQLENDDEFGASTMKEYEALADTEKENYGI